MPRRWTNLIILVCMGCLVLVISLDDVLRAADGGNSALPRREDVRYRAPGAGNLPTGLLSWQRKVDNDSAFAGIDSITPSTWLGGPVYTGISWFWKEDGQPGNIDFVGFASNLDTTIYDPPMRWLPLDPEGTGAWETTSVNNKGETWTFRFNYDGQDTVSAGLVTDPQDFVCWRILLEQEGPTVPEAMDSGSVRDGMGIPRQLRADAKKAFTDTLYYEVDALPRRRIRSANEFPQNEILYRSHLTRETPVSSEETGVSGWKSRFRR